MIHRMLGLTQFNFYVTRINSPIFNFIGIIELIMCLKCLKTDLMKFEILKIENFEVLKIEFLN